MIYTAYFVFGAMAHVLYFFASRILAYCFTEYHVSV